MCPLRLAATLADTWPTLADVREFTGRLYLPTSLNSAHQLTVVVTDTLQTAWESKEKVPIFNGGQQYVPTLHVSKLAKYVYTICETAPAPHYILAVDDDPQTLEALVKVHK
eukprot:160801-Prorocentrum_minimum.AAC.1